MPGCHWSNLKEGQRVNVYIQELGFYRTGTIKYVGGVNGHYALNHKYYTPNLETGDGLEPWIGLELDKPLPFSESHSGREVSGRFHFSCQPDCGYWCRAHQISSIKVHPKSIGALERRKKFPVDTGPILKKDLPMGQKYFCKELRSFYEPPILTDSEDEDCELEHDRDFLLWRENRKGPKNLRLSSEAGKWRELREKTRIVAKPRSASAVTTYRYCDDCLYDYNGGPIPYNGDTRWPKKLKRCRPCKDNAEVWYCKKVSPPPIGTTTRIIAKKPDEEIIEALDTVKESKKFLENLHIQQEADKKILEGLKMKNSVDDRTVAVRASLNVEDDPEKRKNLFSKEKAQIEYYKVGAFDKMMEDLQETKTKAQKAQIETWKKLELDDSFSRLNISARNPDSPRFRYKSPEDKYLRRSRTYSTTPCRSDKKVIVNTTYKCKPVGQVYRHVPAGHTHGSGRDSFYLGY